MYLCCNPEAQLTVLQKLLSLTAKAAPKNPCTNNLSKMAPTPPPPPHPTFQDGSSTRYAGRRRPPNRNSYHQSHHTPPNPQTPLPITPLPDNNVELEELSENDVDGEDEGDGEELDSDEDIDGEENDVDADEEDEGGIEEGALRFYVLFTLVKFTHLLL